MARDCAPTVTAVTVSGADASGGEGLHGLLGGQHRTGDVPEVGQCGGVPVAQLGVLSGGGRVGDERDLEALLEQFGASVLRTLPVSPPELGKVTDAAEPAS